MSCEPLRDRGIEPVVFPAVDEAEAAKRRLSGRDYL